MTWTSSAAGWPEWEGLMGVGGAYEEWEGLGSAVNKFLVNRERGTGWQACFISRIYQLWDFIELITSLKSSALTPEHFRL